MFEEVSYSDMRFFRLWTDFCNFFGKIPSCCLFLSLKFPLLTLYSFLFPPKIPLLPKENIFSSILKGNIPDGADFLIKNGKTRNSLIACIVRRRGAYNFLRV